MDKHELSIEIIKNLIIEKISLINVRNEVDSTPEEYVELILRFNNENEVILVPSSEIEKLDLHKRFIQLRLPLELSPNKANRIIGDHIRTVLEGAVPQERYNFKQVGMHLIKGKPGEPDEPVFVKGSGNGGIIRPAPAKENRPAIEADVPFNMDIDADLSAQNAVGYLLTLVSLSRNVGRIILSYNLMMLIRKMFEIVWKAPRCCPFTYGGTGTMKTTYTQLLSQVYDRAKGIKSPVRLNSSVAAAVNVIYSKSDTVEVLDDLFPSEDPKLRKEQESTLFEITRIIGDGIEPGRMRGKEVARDAPTSGVIFTGEYLVGTGSNAARLLAVEMEKPDGDKLKFFQDNPLIVSTAYHHFIEWVLNNYDDVLTYIRKWRGIYSSLSMGVHARLQETHFFFTVTYGVFLEFAHSNGCISEADAKAFHNAFVEMLNTLIQAQNKRVLQETFTENNSTDIDFFANIKAMYKNGEFNLAKTAKEFTPNHDGIIHNHHLCLWGKPFKEKICKSVFNADYNIVLDSLEANDALKRGADRRTIQISGTRGRRFYAIPMVTLI